MFMSLRYILLLSERFNMSLAHQSYCDRRMSIVRSALWVVRNLFKGNRPLN